MLLPENMVRLQIITDKSNLNPIVTKLLKYGVFQPEDPLYPIGNGRIDEARKLITPVQDHISKVKIIMELGGLIIEPLGKMKVEDWIIASDQTNSEALKLEERYKELLEEIGRLRAERDLYLQQLKDLEPFKTITVELNTLYSSELFNVILAIVSEDKLNLLNESLRDKGFVYAVKSGEKSFSVIIITKKEVELDKILKEIGVRRFELQEGKSPYQLYNDLQEKVNQINIILERTRDELAKKG